MPTQIHELTPAPTDLVAALSLVVGTKYSARFQTSEVQGISKVVEAAAAPTPDSAALLIQRFEDVIVQPASGLGVYVWSDAADGLLVINEVPA